MRRPLALASLVLLACGPSPRVWELRELDGQVTRVKASAPRGWTEHRNKTGEPTLALTDQPTPWVSVHVSFDRGADAKTRLANVARDQLSGVDPVERADGKLFTLEADPDGKRTGRLLMAGPGERVIGCTWAFVADPSQEAQVRSFCDSVEVVSTP